jgi:NAD(P)-dependent dehydrogenase (short-subunit alcohol dehydrogenase family)
MENNFSLSGKTILITGASSGIGKATAIACANLDANVITTGRNLIKLKNTFDLLVGSNHRMIPFDFEENNLNDFISTLPQLDGIVHSAGIIDSIPYQFTNEKKLEKVMNINFSIPFHLTRLLLKSKKINKNSSIVFVSSISGISITAVGHAAYSASKGALSACTRVLALENAPQQIRVNSVCPGMVKTEMIYNNPAYTKDDLLADEKRNYPLGYGNPENVAEPIAFLLSNAAKWITGSNIIIDGGASIQ